MKDDFHLALYRGASADTIAVDDYLALNADARAGVAADLDMATISLIVDGQERIAHLASLGPLAALVPQLEPARARLSRRDPALVRSGVVDLDDGHYLLFEPDPSGDRVNVSVVSTDARPESSWFPHGPHGDALYAHVAAHRSALLARTRAAGALPVELPMDRDRLLAALAREAKSGAALLASPGGVR